VALEDLAVGEPLKVSIAPIQLKAENLSTAKGQRGNVSLRAGIAKSGALAASGPLTLEPLAGNFRVDARTIDFAFAQRYVDDMVNLAITSGAVSAKGTAAFARARDGAIKASYKGDVGVTDFASVDKPTTQDLVKWKSLSLGAIDFALEPLHVAVDDVALADFFARIILSAEGRLNLQDLGSSPERHRPATRPPRNPRRRPQTSPLRRPPNGRPKHQSRPPRRPWRRSPRTSASARSRCRAATSTSATSSSSRTTARTSPASAGP
jgi:hypothetical protein